MVYITQIMEEVASAGRVVALAGGEIAFDGTPAELFSNQQLLEDIGLEPPLPVRLAAGLSARGYQTSTAVTLSELVRSIFA